MESFGEILQKNRENLGIDLDKAERDTSIFRGYLEALEKERIDEFPGKPYLIGFLRNYSEYLGVDADHMIALYRAKIIQEAPVPEELLRDKKTKKWIPIAAVGAGCALAAGALLYFFLAPQKEDSSKVVVAAAAAGQRYTLTGTPVQKRIYENDVLVVPGEKEIELVVYETHTALALKTPVGLQYIELGEESELDIDNVPGAEVVVFLSDISKTDASRGAEVRMFLKNADDAVQIAEPQSDQAADAAGTTVSADTIRKPAGKQVVVFDSTYAYPFTVNAVFRGACLFRYQSDRNDPVEAYYASGDILNMQARNSGVRVWMSNANAVKLQVIGDAGRTYDLEIGRAGQVIVNDIKWIRDTDGRYKLVVTDVD